MKVVWEYLLAIPAKKPFKRIFAIQHHFKPAWHPFSPGLWLGSKGGRGKGRGVKCAGLFDVQRLSSTVFESL